MDTDFNKAIMKMTCGLAALLMLLEEKGILTEDEYKKKYDEVKEVLIQETIATIKKSV